MSGCGLWGLLRSLGWLSATLVSAAFTAAFFTTTAAFFGCGSFFGFVFFASCLEGFNLFFQIVELLFERLLFFGFGFVVNFVLVINFFFVVNFVFAIDFGGVVFVVGLAGFAGLVNFGRFLIVVGFFGGGGLFGFA